MIYIFSLIVLILSYTSVYFLNIQKIQYSQNSAFSLYTIMISILIITINTLMTYFIKYIIKFEYFISRSKEISKIILRSVIKLTLNSSICLIII